MDPPRQVAAFPAIFAAVLGRLACDSVNGRPVVVAAELHRGRLAGYDGQSGEQLWLRSDLPPVLEIGLAGRAHVAVAFLRSRALLVDLATGETTATGLRWRSLFTFEGIGLAAANFDGYAAIVDPWAARKRWRIPDAGLGVLDVAGAPPGRLLVASSSPLESGDSAPSLVREFDADGSLAWMHESRHGFNVPWLGHDPAMDLWLGVEQDPEMRAAAELIRWQPDGSVIDRRRLPGGRAEYAFLASGRILAIAPTKGPDPVIMLDTRTGSVVGTLD
jgi:hypothetical protein